MTCSTAIQTSRSCPRSHLSSGQDSGFYCSTAEFDALSWMGDNTKTCADCAALDDTGLDVRRIEGFGVIDGTERAAQAGDRAAVAGLIAADSAVRRRSRKGTDLSMASVDMVADRTRAGNSRVEQFTERHASAISRGDDGEVRIRRVDHTDHRVQPAGISGNGDIARGDQCAEILACQQGSNQNRPRQGERGVRIG